MLNKFCHFPFTRIQINPDGKVYTCCPGWLSTPIGNIFEESLPDIWNSETANKIRKTILDGTFVLCQHHKCPRIIDKTIFKAQELKKGRKHALRSRIRQYTGLFDKGPQLISLSYDLTCNLFCPQCRNERQVLAEPERKKVLTFQQAFLRSKYFRQAQRLIVTGQGDPFASQVYMDLFQDIREGDNPGLKITVRTNGTLLSPKNWERLRNSHYAIDQIWISIDAATEQTYRIVRRGGDFKALLHNLAFLKELKRRHPLKIFLYFVVQHVNYQEMQAFVELAKRFDCDKVTFGQIFNLTYSRQEYDDVAVQNPTHPDFQEFKRIINTPIFRDPIVNLSNLSHLLEE